MDREIDTPARNIGSPAGDYLSDADVLLTRAETAEYLRSSVPTLERWAIKGEGPPYKMVGGRALYSLPGVRQFAGVAAPQQRAG